MKIRKISPHIMKLEAWCFFKVSAWLVQAKDGIYIIDTGMAFMGKAILREAEKLGEVKGILLTHGHSDHIGGLKNIIKQKNIPTYAHQLELLHIEGEQPYPGRKKPEQPAVPGHVQPLLSDANGQMLPIADLIPYHTPGHSPGHVAYYHAEDKVLISGDLFTSKNGRLQKPMAMFTADMKEAVASGAIVAELKPKLVSIAHSADIEDAHTQIADYLSAGASAADTNTKRSAL